MFYLTLEHGAGLESAKLELRTFSWAF